MNMKQWVKDQIAATEKKPLPVLTYPAIQSMGVTMNDLIYSADLQAQAMLYIHDHVDMPAVLGFMDLSVEAEQFGSEIRYSDDEVPVVLGPIIARDGSADELPTPDPREGRTGICIEGVRKIATMVDDKPILAGNIGPFSLAGRLMDVNNIMFLCYDNPELVHAVLDKATDFILAYTKELKAAGADGVVMAEPLAGLLSPDLTEEFSNPYVKRIVDETQDDEFIVVLHNCGSSVSHTIDGMVKTGAAAFHLGNAVDMAEMMPHIPEDCLCFGNIDPAARFRFGTLEEMRASTLELLEACAQYPNFIISSGCDIPQASSWENINCFFETVHDFYAAPAEEPVVAERPIRRAATMTSRERFFAAINHEPVDRIPVYPMIAGASRVLVGVSHKEWALNADLCAKGYIEMSKMLPEEDFVLALVDLMVEASAWGQPLIFSGNNPAAPDFANMVIKTADDYGTIETIDAAQGERMVMMRDVCAKLVDELKGEKPIIAYVLDPLSVLSFLRGQKQMKRDFADHADEIHQAVEKVAVTLEQYVGMLMDTGIDGIMWDTYFAGGSAMPREQWSGLEADCMARLAQLVRDRGGINMVHSCQSRPYFDLLIETMQPSVISFFRPADGCADLAETKATYGDKVTLMGSVTPWNSVFGTDIEWDQECAEVIRTLNSDGTGFILAPGCFYPANASLGRAKRMIDIAVRASQ